MKKETEGKQPKLNLKNTVLVSHKNCMDGSTCAIVYNNMGGDLNNVYFVNPSHEDSDELICDLVKNYTGQIIVADISISLKLAQKLDQYNTNIVILDHHKTAIPLNKFNWCEIEVKNNRSGAMMLYDYFHSTDLSLRELVEAADDFDRWIKKNPLSEKLATLHQALGQESFVKKYCNKLYPIFNSQDQYMIDVYNSKNDVFIKSKKKECVFYNITVQGHPVRIGVVVAPNQDKSAISVLGNAICSDPELDCDIAVLCNGNMISFRANVDCPVDLSVVAKNNGGGGHKLASGTSLGCVLKEDFCRILFDKISWNGPEI